MQDLIARAEKFALSCKTEAWGKCFVSTMRFAVDCDVATHHAATIVRWRVKDDADFCEHWAIGIGDNKVLDLTHVQVDGDVSVLHEISSYPKNYVNVKHYPINFALQLGDLTSPQFSHREIRRFRCALLCFDIKQASFFVKPLVLLKSLAELFHFVYWQNSSHWLKRLERRKALLKDRLKHY